MKKYELTVILTPGLASDALSGAIAAIEKAVKSVKGKVVESLDWGEKQFSYTINKFDKGVYRHFVLDLPSESVASLESKINHISSVIRMLLVRS